MVRRFQFDFPFRWGRGQLNYSVFSYLENIIFSVFIIYRTFHIHKIPSNLFGNLIFYIYKPLDCLYFFIKELENNFGKIQNFPYLYNMKTKSIIYKSFVPQVESTPAISLNESPTFKYTGYKPHYK